MLSRLHMRLQPRSHAVAGTLPGAACLESLERAGQSDNFELETHWRMLILGGGTGAGTLAPPRPTHHPARRPEHAAHSTSSTYSTCLLCLLTYSTYLLTPPTYLLHLPTYSIYSLHLPASLHVHAHALTHLRCSLYPLYSLYLNCP